MPPRHGGIEEACHSRIALRLGCQNVRAYLSEEGGHTTAELPPFSTEEQRAWERLLIGLAGAVGRAIYFNEDPINALDGPFSISDKLEINHGISVLGRKYKERGVFVLEQALLEDWHSVLELADALANPEPQIAMPVNFGTPIRKGGEQVTGPMLMTPLPKFPNLKPRRSRVAALLAEDLSLPGLPSLDEVQPKRKFGLFETQEKRKTITRDANQDIVSTLEESPIGFDRLTETLSNLTHSIESAVKDSLRPRKVRRLVERDNFGDIKTITEEEF